MLVVTLLVVSFLYIYTYGKHHVDTILVYTTFFSVRKLLFYLHEIVEGLYFHCSLSVCVSVCPALLVNKIQPIGCTDLNTVFAKWLLIKLARTLLILVTFG